MVTRDRATGAVQLTSGGYGYGLRVAQNCTFRTMVSHTGGLPGFGSVMTWLPDYGIGIVAFGNLTYTGWGGIATTALETLVKKLDLHPRQPSPSPALTDVRDKVSRLVANWDDRLADSVAAENLFLDQTKERRRAEIERLRANGRRLCARQRLRHGRECAARVVDAELRERKAGGGDHAGADDAAEGAVPVGPARASIHRRGPARALKRFRQAVSLR